ncbi:MAG: extracellular solute-binding protein [Verrucomicrobiota bacterium]
MKHLTALLLVPLLALTGCGKKDSAADAATSPTTPADTPDIRPEMQAFYAANPDFFVLDATPADLPADLAWENGADVETFASPNAKRGGTIRGAIDDFPRTLRIIGPDSNGSFRTYIHDDNSLSLLGKHPNTADYYPALATAWALAPDGRTMYFKLDPDARWSDGTPVTADDYLFAFFFYRTSHINAPWYNNFYGVNYTRIAKFDDHTIAITAKEAKPDIHDRLGGLGPVPAHFYRELGPDFPQRYQWRLVPSTGPYTVREADIKKGQSITLSRVENWWAADKPFFKNRYNFDRIQLDVIRDPDKAFESFKRGDLDTANLTLPKYWYDKLPDSDSLVQSGYVHKTVFYNEVPRPTFGLYINSARPILENRDVREGINHAANFQLVIDSYFRGDYTRMQSTADGYALVPFPDIKARPYSVEKAAEAFAKAGFTKRGPDGILINDRGERLSFTVTTGYKTMQDVLAILRQEARKCGLELNLEVLDGTTAWKKIQEKQHDIAFSAFGVGVEMYPRYWETWHSANANKPQTNNLTNLADPAIDTLIDRYDRATSIEEVRTIATELEERIREQAVFVPGFVIPFFRAGYWRWMRWPEGFSQRLAESANQFGTAWIDETERAATLEARKSGKTYEPSIEVYNQWKPKE